MYFLKAYFIFYGDEHDDNAHQSWASLNSKKETESCFVCIIFDDQFTLIVLLLGKMDKSDIITVMHAHKSGMDGRWIGWESTHVSPANHIPQMPLIKNTW